jgi:hypothetical protein
LLGLIFDSHEQVRFEGFIAVALKVTGLWDVTYSLVEIYHNSVDTAPPISILKMDVTGSSFKQFPPC